MSLVERNCRLYNRNAFFDAAQHLEECLKEVWCNHTNDNHNKVVGAINRMNRHATDDGRDETAAYIRFTEIVLDLERRGYKFIADLEFKDFREYLDKDFEPYD